MATGIEERVARAAETLRVYELRRQRADDLHRRVGLLEARLPELTDRHAAEQRDVDRLEGLSLTRVVVALRGSRTAELERERAEAAQARYRLADVEARLAAVRGELTATRAGLSGRDEARAELTAALAAKEEHLRDVGDARVGPLLALAEERGRLTGELHEIGEAEQAAARAAAALTAVDRILHSAEGWSTVDTFLGGGMLCSVVKHSRLDEAAQAAAHADRCLAVLRTELADVDGVTPSAVQVAVDGLTRFVDVWCDNVFTDLAVGDRIRQAQDNVAGAQARVSSVRHRLTRRTGRTLERLSAIEGERRTLLTG